MLNELYSRLCASLFRRFSSPSPQILSLPHIEAELPTSNFIDNDQLLKRLRVQWQFGDWESLVNFDIESLHTRPHRAVVALFISSGYIQLGNIEKAKEYVQLALDLGCNKQLVATILVSGLYTSLGCAFSLIKNDTRSFHYFEQSIRVSGFGGDISLLTNARLQQQLKILGLTSGACGRLQTLEAYYAENKSNTYKAKYLSKCFDSEAHSFYMNISRRRCFDKNLFILFDCKSLPRSGLHYLKNTFSNILQTCFSFCEWYNEPGCCKKFPCAITSLAEQCFEENKSHLRIQKSHDLQLCDPPYETSHCLRRIILIREPIYILTSWFLLDQLNRYKTVLMNKNIGMKKIYYLHEPQIYASASQIIDQEFRAISAFDLHRWLESKSKYINSFMQKWVYPFQNDPTQYVYLVEYHKINEFITMVIDEYKNIVPQEILMRINDFKPNKTNFKARKDPFTLSCNNISHFLKNNSETFWTYANKIKPMI